VLSIHCDIVKYTPLTLLTSQSCDTCHCWWSVHAVHPVPSSRCPPVSWQHQYLRGDNRTRHWSKWAWSAMSWEWHASHNRSPSHLHTHVTSRDTPWRHFYTLARQCIEVGHTLCNIFRVLKFGHRQLLIEILIDRLINIFICLLINLQSKNW
jgi:hypothetical protein